MRQRCLLANVFSVCSCCLISWPSRMTSVSGDIARQWSASPPEQVGSHAIRVWRPTATCYLFHPTSLHNHTLHPSLYTLPTPLHPSLCSLYTPSTPHSTHSLHPSAPHSTHSPHPPPHSTHSPHPPPLILLTLHTLHPSLYTLPTPSTPTLSYSPSPQPCGAASVRASYSST